MSFHHVYSNPAERRAAWVRRVRAHGRPYPWRALTGRLELSDLPDDLIRWGRDDVWLRERVPAWSVWVSRVERLARTLFREHPTTTVWSTEALYQHFRQRAVLPAWLDAYSLESLLRHGTVGRCIGRGRVCVSGAHAGHMPQGSSQPPVAPAPASPAEAPAAPSPLPAAFEAWLREWPEALAREIRARWPGLETVEELEPQSWHDALTARPDDRVEPVQIARITDALVALVSRAFSGASVDLGALLLVRHVCSLRLDDLRIGSLDAVEVALAHCASSPRLVRAAGRA